jgi:hypothetical protein
MKNFPLVAGNDPGGSRRFVASSHPLIVGVCGDPMQTWATEVGTLDALVFTP